MNEINESVFWAAITHLKDVRRERINKLVIEIIHEKKMTLSDFFGMDYDVAAQSFALNEKEQLAFISAKEQLPTLSFTIEDLFQKDINIIPLNSELYPKILKDNLKISKSPTVLYTRGNLKIFQEKAIAIVGSRAASENSLIFTENIARTASERFEVVVSGFAKGVDRCALESALKYKGQTIVVLPQGISTFDSGIKKYYEQIVSGDMIIVSAFPPHAGWSVELAMARNPIIYGFAESIFIAETSDSGGTWAGAIDGIKKGRKIFVRLPETSEKCSNNLLIDMGAIPVDINGNEVAHARVSLEFFDESASKAAMIKKKPTGNTDYLEQIYNLIESLNNIEISSAEIIKKLNLDMSAGKLTTKLKNDVKLEIVSGSPLKFKLRDFKGENTLFG